MLANRLSCHNGWLGTKSKLCVLHTHTLPSTNTFALRENRTHTHVRGDTIERNKLQIGLGLILGGYNAWYAQCEKPLMLTLSSADGVKLAKDLPACHTPPGHSVRAVCVLESKTQKWFLTFRLINLLQLNTFNDFWRTATGDRRLALRSPFVLADQPPLFQFFS